MKARLTASRQLSANTRHFEFESPDWKPAFVPGQFLSFTHDEVTRAYSIASPPGGETFALCANLVDGGRFSPFLFGMKRGDEVDFKGPYGAFIMRREPAHSIFVATGTGIAPFRSMAQAGANITLIFGVRHEESLLYHEEWLQSGVDYRPTLTRPGGNWAGRAGRVQAHTMEALEEQRDANIYLCGMKEMVDDLRAQLKAAGVDRRRIIYEKYD